MSKIFLSFCPCFIDVLSSCPYYVHVLSCFQTRRRTQSQSTLPATVQFPAQPLLLPRRRPPSSPPVAQRARLATSITPIATVLLATAATVTLPVLHQHRRRLRRKVRIKIPRNIRMRLRRTNTIHSVQARHRKALKVRRPQRQWLQRRLLLQRKLAKNCRIIITLTRVHINT